MSHGPIFFVAFRKILRKAIIFLTSACPPSVCLSIHHGHNSASTGRIFIKFDISVFSPRKSVEKSQVALKADKNNGYFTWRPMYIYDSFSPSSCLYWKCRGNHNTHFMFQNSPPPSPHPEIRAVYETTWENIVEPDRPQMTTRRLRIACLIAKAGIRIAFSQ